MACEVCQERVDHGIDSHQQEAHQIIPPFIVGLRETLHDFRAQVVGALVEGALYKEAGDGV